jgi:hypothetical protein
MIASELSNLKHGGDRKSDQDATLQLENMSRSDASELLNVSKRSVDKAAAINKVSPDLANEIKSGSKILWPRHAGRPRRSRKSYRRRKFRSRSRALTSTWIAKVMKEPKRS